MARASDLLAIARAELGVKESPANSNNVKYNTAYYGREVWDGVAGGKYPWCMVFIWWLFQRAGASGLFYGGKKTASCGALMTYAQAHGQWVTGDYRAGDIVIYDFPGGAATDHCGIVESVGTAGIMAIEGNTAVGNDDNGGKVMERSRKFGVIVGAVRPQYDMYGMEDEDMLDIETLTEEQLIRLAERMQAALAKRPIGAVLAPELEEAKALDITDGSNPNAFCTRAQAAVMVKRAAK